MFFTRPEHAKEIFAGDPEIFHAGKANGILGPIMGEHSLLLQDSAEHKRARKLLMPAFNGHALREYQSLVTEVAQAEVATWQPGEEFRSLDRMNRAHPRGDPARRLRRHRRAPARRSCGPRVNKTVNISPAILLGWGYPKLQKFGPWKRTVDNQRELDELMYAEIRERRTAPDLAERTDVLSRLIVQGEDGDDALDATPSCATSWSPCCSPATRPRRPRWPGRSTRSAATPSCSPAAGPRPTEGDDDYLEAVVKESMRLHPVIPMVVRTLMQPATIAGYDLPKGTTVGPSIIIAHQRDGQPRRPGGLPARALPRPQPADEHVDPLRRRRPPLHRRRLRADGGRGRAARGVRGVRRHRGRRRRAQGPQHHQRARATARGSGSPDKPLARHRRVLGRSSLVIDRLRALRMDTTPLRASRDFRLLFLAGTVFYFGAMVSYVAIPFQVYTLTGSNFAVGAIGLVELAPIVVFGLYGGALADHVDRRRLLIAHRARRRPVFTAVLAVNAFRDDPDVWVIFVVSVALAVLLGAAATLARGAAAAHRDPRPAARGQRAVAASASSSGVLVGPAVGGLLVAYVGIGWCFVVDVGGLVRRVVPLRADAAPTRTATETTPPSLAGIKEGMVYAFRRRDLLGTYFVDIVAMMFADAGGALPGAGRARSSASRSCSACSTPPRSSGAMAATALSGWTARVHHHGRAIVIAAAAFGAMVALAGLMPNIWLVAALPRARRRGRHDLRDLPRARSGARRSPSACAVGWPASRCCPTRSARSPARSAAGVTADLWSVRGAIVSGGLACVAGVGVTAAWLRDFWTYDSRTDEHAVAERATRQAAGES